MHDFEFSQDGGGVVGQDHFLQVVDDEFVSAIRTEGGLDSARNCPAGIDVADDGAIFCVVAVAGSVLVKLEMKRFQSYFW